MRQISSIFIYQKKAYTFNEATRKTEEVIDLDGKPRYNDNYISFLQVISTYWEVMDGKLQLNVFLNGGSVSRDRDTGATSMKAGYTVIFTQALGEKFMNQWYEWSIRFGLSTAPAAPQQHHREPHDRPRSGGGRSVREDDFRDPDSEPMVPAWEAPETAV